MKIIKEGKMFEGKCKCGCEFEYRPVEVMIKKEIPEVKYVRCPWCGKNIEHIEDKEEVSHQGIIIFTDNYRKALYVANYYINNYDTCEVCVSPSRISIKLTDGRHIKWVKLNENARGNKCSEAYIDRDVSDDIYNNVVRRACIYCSPETMRMI